MKIVKLITMIIRRVVVMVSIAIISDSKNFSNNFWLICEFKTFYHVM